MKFWLVSEGSSDVPLITQALKNCEAALGKTIELLPQAPVTDATTGNAERFGYPEVLDWCRTNGSGRQLMATKYRYMMGGATALIVHLDADIAENLSVNGQQFQAEGDRVTWVRAALLEALGALAAELKIILAVPKMQIETWILATYTLAE